VIVADTSAWIEFLRGTGSPEALILRELAAGDALLVGDLILAEVLQGARHDQAAAEAEQLMRQHTVVGLMSDRMPREASTNYRHLRARGITVRGTIDLLIGTFCIAHGHTLLHRDRDFDVMEQHLGLRVVHA
jgi:predicted nucleic acid-binding protein